MRTPDIASRLDRRLEYFARVHLVALALRVAGKNALPGLLYTHLPLALDLFED
jgi:hypothetical protein